MVSDTGIGIDPAFMESMFDTFRQAGQIREILGPDAPTVTIAVSAYAGARDRERSARAGFRRHLAKPIDPQALLELVGEMVGSTT